MVSFIAPHGEAGDPEARVAPRNILLLIVDDLSPRLGCYGDAQAVSPNIDAFASTAMRFDRAYCQFPQCGPSRASLLTSIRPERTMGKDKGNPNTIDRNKVYSQATSLPAHLTSLGYRTAHFGKIYHEVSDNQSAWTDPHPDRDNESRGDLNGLWGYPGYALPENLRALESIREEARQAGDKRWYVRTAVSTEAADVPDNGYYDGITTDRSIAMLDDMAKDRSKPFFLAIGWYKPHLAFCAPKQYWDLYDREKLTLADNNYFPQGSPQAAHSWGEQELRGYTDIPDDGPIPEAKQRELVHGYYACVSFIDAQVGRVLDELDRLGLADDTVVVLLGDHGFHLGENGHWTKNINWERSHHAPLIVRVPGHAAGHTSSLVEFVDLYPTLMEAAGLPMPAHEPEGQSAMRLLEDPQQPFKSAAFTFFNGNLSACTDRYRYTPYRRDGQLIGEELFDLQQDPGCNVNRADDPAYASVKEDMIARHKAGWRQARSEELEPSQP